MGILSTTWRPLMAFQRPTMGLLSTSWRPLVVFLAVCQVVLLMMMYQAYPISLSLHYHPPLYSRMDTGNPPVFRLPELDINSYFTQIGNRSCYTLGTQTGAPLLTGRCQCVPGFTGPDCGVPSVVAEALEKAGMKVTRRERPRRIIYALPFNHELDMLEARMHEHWDAVDVFLVAESNFTNAGKPKPLLLLEKLRSGWMEDMQEKIVYVGRNKPPPGGFSDGKAVDADMRAHLSRDGLRLLSDVRLDDMFLVSDTDVIPKASILHFLKLYSGFPHLIALKFRWSIFGFFWPVDPSVHGHGSIHDPTAMTIRFFRDFYDYDASKVRSDLYKLNTEAKQKFGSIGEEVGPLNIDAAGWHCSWCFHPDGVSKKLLDAPYSDYPRYGDYPGKTEVKYIQRLIKHGLYFDGSRIREGEVGEIEDEDFAPEYVLNNRDKFLYLIQNPYRNVSLPRNSV